jgi:hypothetical protein
VSELDESDAALGRLIQLGHRIDPDDLGEPDDDPDDLDDLDGVRSDGCGDWCRPLHLVERAIAGQPFARYFLVDHFMFMGVVRRRGRPDIVLNKHGHTRRYLNLDAEGHAYRYLPPPPTSSRLGQYRPHHDLVAAIDDLHLHELPWLAFSGFDHERRGLSYDDQWDRRPRRRRR